MVANLAKLADRSFIVGFLFPALVFYSCALLLIVEPVNPALYKTLTESVTLGDVLYNALLVWTLAIFLMLGNDPLYKLLEGYWPPLSWIKPLKAREERKLDAIDSEIAALRARWIDEGKAFPASDIARYTELIRQRVDRYPEKPESILPTRFGNAIRAFETYSSAVYRVDSIPLWIHLSTVFSDDFREAVEDVRTAVNCAMNFVFLAGLLAIGLIVVFAMSFDYALRIWEVRPFLDSGDYGLLLAAVVSLGVAWGSYELAIDRAVGWGRVVRAGFDCYLPALAKQLGYKLPDDPAVQGEFWEAVSRRAIYNQTFPPELLAKLQPPEAGKTAPAK